MTYEEYQKRKRKLENAIEDNHTQLISLKAKLDYLDEIYQKEGSKANKRRTWKKDKSDYTYDPSQDINKTDIMRSSLAHMGATFKTKNFVAYLKAHHPHIKFSDTFVSNTLRKFVKKEGIVEVVSRGEKKKGYVYRRKTG